MNNVVSLVRAHLPKKAIKTSIAEALDLIDFKPKNPVNSISIKVNLCYYWAAATGQTTDPRVTAGIIDYVRERYGKDVHIRVVEADATAMRTKHVFLMLGYEKLAKEKGVELFNLCKDNLYEKTVKVNGREITFKVPQSLLESDLFINVPKLKTVSETKVTCALKNIFGCIGEPRKFAYHPFLHEAIIGINKILHPDLTIVDGIVALGRFPIRLDLIMAGADPYAVDLVASKIMGFSPSKVGYLKIALKEKLVDSRSVTTRGEDLKTLKKEFPAVNFFYSKKWWNIQLGLLKTYATLANDVIPPFLEKT